MMAGGERYLCLYCWFFNPWSWWCKLRDCERHPEDEGCESWVDREEVEREARRLPM